MSASLPSDRRQRILQAINPLHFFRLHRLTSLPLGLEIFLILCIKIAILTVLAKTFFSAPQAKHMRMPTEQVEQHLLPPSTNASAPASATNSSTVTSSSALTPTSEVSHASH